MSKGGILGFFTWLFYGKEGKKEEPDKKPLPQQLQAAVQREVDLAKAKRELASMAIVTSQKLRGELKKLVAQSDELGRQAFLAEKDGKPEEAKRYLALQLAINEKVSNTTEQYEAADKNARQLISEAQKQSAVALNASKDLPKKVLQVEINKMLEDARSLESQAMAQVTGKQSYQALAESIEMKTATLMTQQLLTDSSGPDLEQDVETVMKEVEFGKAYKQLQEKVQEGGGAVIDAEFTEVVNPADKARLLLEEAPFGGLLGQEVRVLSRQPVGEGEEEK
jgi:hypothetical protein